MKSALWQTKNRGSLTAKYSQMLVLFADYHTEDITRITEGLASNSLETLKKVAHALKSEAGHVAAIRLLESAKRLQLAIAQNAGQYEIKTCCTVLIAELTLLIQGIRSALNEKQQGESNAPF